MKLINDFWPGEIVPLENTQLPILLVEKGLRQEGHLAVKFLLQNIVVRNNGTGTLSEGVVNGTAGVNVRPVRSISCEILQKRFKLRITSLNDGTMRGKASEIVETLARRIDICAVQETRWRGCSTRMITGKHCRFKFLWFGDKPGFGGVGILVISVDRTSCRQMSLRLLIGRKILYIIFSYVPQLGLPESEKDTFFFNLLSCISIIPAEEMLLVCGDLVVLVKLQVVLKVYMEGMVMESEIQRVQEFSNYVLQQI